MKETFSGFKTTFKHFYMVKQSFEFFFSLEHFNSNQYVFCSVYRLHNVVYIIYYVMTNIFCWFTTAVYLLLPFIVADEYSFK